MYAVIWYHLASYLSVVVRNFCNVSSSCRLLQSNTLAFTVSGFILASTQLISNSHSEMVPTLLCLHRNHAPNQSCEEHSLHLTFEKLWFPFVRQNKFMSTSSGVLQLDHSFALIWTAVCGCTWHVFFRLHDHTCRRSSHKLLVFLVVVNACIATC